MIKMKKFMCKDCVFVGDGYCTALNDDDGVAAASTPEWPAVSPGEIVGNIRSRPGLHDDRLFDDPEGGTI